MSTAVGRVDNEGQRAVLYRIQTWIKSEVADVSTLVSRAIESDAQRVVLRYGGVSKTVITVWISVNERTTTFETYLMGYPEENEEALLTYALRKNHELFPLHLAIGLENALYLTGRVATSEVDVATLDLFVGASIEAVEEIFPVAMSIGYASRYRYQPVLAPQDV